MKASDFIAMLADEIDCTYADARLFLSGFRRCIEKALLGGHRVMLYGLGSFRLHRFGKRRNYDLNAGKVVDLEPVTRIEFYEAPLLRKKVENVIPLEDINDDESGEEEQDA